MTTTIFIVQRLKFPTGIRATCYSLEFEFAVPTVSPAAAIINAEKS
jgi:hypothetical protein